MKRIKNLKGIIIVVTISLLIIGVICFITLKSDKQDKPIDNNTKETTKLKEETPSSPASNTEELVANHKQITETKVTKDEIILPEDEKIINGEKIAVWVYSNPKFLGYFEVVTENGVKKLKGLQEKIEELNIETGNHNIALVTEKGISIGYINIYIESGSIVDNNKEQSDIIEIPEEDKTEDLATTKEVTYEEEIAYEITTIKEKNMQKDKKVVTQEGKKGLKKVTYDITYDANGKEISRKKKSEQVVKEPVNKIEKIGTSDFNLNTAKMTGAFHGIMCTESDLYTAEDGERYCNDTEGQMYNEFYAIGIDNVNYVTCANTTGCYGEKVNTFAKLTSSGAYLYKGTINGKTYYFDARAGDSAQSPLTQIDCDTFKLTCGTW